MIPFFTIYDTLKIKNTKNEKNLPLIMYYHLHIVFLFF
jgi:hypothetical protein